MKRVLWAAVLSLGLILGMAGAADAVANTRISIPKSNYGVVGDGQIAWLGKHANSGFRWSFKFRSSDEGAGAYISAQGVRKKKPDPDAFRLTTNVFDSTTTLKGRKDGGYRVSVQGYRFRLCQDVPKKRDKCGKWSKVYYH